MATYVRYDSSDSITEQPIATRALPCGFWWPILIGAFVGVSLRLAFSGHRFGYPYQPMLAAFIYIVPVLVAVVTVYVAEKTRRRSWAYYFWVPALANLLLAHLGDIGDHD